MRIQAFVISLFIGLFGSPVTYAEDDRGKALRDLLANGGDFSPERLCVLRSDEPALVFAPPLKVEEYQLISNNVLGSVLNHH